MVCAFLRNSGLKAPNRHIAHGQFNLQWTGWSILFTWYAAALAAFVVAIPLLIKTGRAVIESVDNNMIQASFALGLSEFQTAVYIVLPLARKGILAGVILSFARALFLRL